MSNSELELSQGFNKGSRLNITNSSTQFNDTDIWFHSRGVNRNSGNTLNPVLDGISDMRNNLNSFTQVVSFSLLLNHSRVNLACGDIVVFSERNTQVSFIVSQIKIHFSTIVQNKALPVL
ncbi:hypothetical protein OGATHE_002770 [Ogataea polymorpha]|uniref:Uncharacterized protein n=1 Tax=Ogataea polymorpha TaxID=460523 RepID=A0A9P8PES4_9ASCO|nr:hypothetical protein OGATHE_002770 [Ogataea polymorpha]